MITLITAIALRKEFNQDKEAAITCMVTLLAVETALLCLLLLLQSK